jgi:hypothetical protein
VLGGQARRSNWFALRPDAREIVQCKASCKAFSLGSVWASPLGERSRRSAEGSLPACQCQTARLPIDCRNVTQRLPKRCEPDCQTANWSRAGILSWQSGPEQRTPPTEDDGLVRLFPQPLLQTIGSFHGQGEQPIDRREMVLGRASVCLQEAPCGRREFGQRPRCPRRSPFFLTADDLDHSTGCVGQKV